MLQLQGLVPCRLVHAPVGLVYHWLITFSYVVWMGDVRKLDQSKPRKLGETVWSEKGLRLGSAQEAAEGSWFLPALFAISLAAFMIIFFW